MVEAFVFLAIGLPWLGALAGLVGRRLRIRGCSTRWPCSSRSPAPSPPLR